MQKQNNVASRYTVIEKLCVINCRSLHEVNLYIYNNAIPLYKRTPQKQSGITQNKLLEIAQLSQKCNKTWASLGSKQ